VAQKKRENLLAAFRASLSDRDRFSVFQFRNGRLVLLQKVTKQTAPPHQPETGRISPAISD
jgi:hypothetical protein